MLSKDSFSMRLDYLMSLLLCCLHAATGTVVLGGVDSVPAGGAASGAAAWQERQWAWQQGWLTKLASYAKFAPAVQAPAHCTSLQARLWPGLQVGCAQAHAG